VTYADIPPNAAAPGPLLIASTNAGKLREITRILTGAGLTLRTLADLPPLPEPEETGLTFAANAELKARYYAEATGLATVAEDSGLAIDALGGRPGVLSARYPGTTYAEKFARLYRELEPHPRPWRARFVCALALVGPHDWALGLMPSAWPVLFACEGVVEGEIAPAPRGSNGFGYDPIFYFPPYERTLGETTDEEKLAVSHRGQAFRNLRRSLETSRAPCPNSRMPR
jgi:XTP/dITP diphosphohydrolase